MGMQVCNPVDVCACTPVGTQVSKSMDVCMYVCTHMHTGMQACKYGAQRKTLGVLCQSHIALRKGLSRSFAAWFSKGS